MDQFIKEWGPVVTWLLTSGALLGFLKSVYDSIQRAKAGQSVKEHKRRVDIVVQRDDAIGEAEDYRDAYWDLRAFCQRHTPDNYMPPIPQAVQDRIREGRRYQ